MIQNKLTSNLMIKILCVVAAMCLWLFVSVSQNSTAKLPGTIKIKAINVSENLVPRYDEKTVEIKIMASSGLWQKISADSFAASIDLAGLSEGTHDVVVNVYSNIAGVSVVDRTPKSVLVTLEPLISVDLPVVKKIQGNPADGMIVNNVSFVPSTVTVKGPKSVLEGIQEASTLVSLQGESESFNRDFPVYVYDDQGQIIPDLVISPDKVQTKVELGKGSNVRSVGIRANITGSPKNNYFVSDISISPSIVEITGTAAVLSSIKSIDTKPIDISGLDANIDRDMVLVLPEGISLLSSNSYKVRVSVTISSNEITKELSVTNIAAKNLDGTSISTYTPSSIGIVCRGALDKINSLSSSDVTLMLDFRNKTANSNGEISFSLDATNFLVPEGITVSEVKQKTVVAKAK
jgi:YbbR domain-containing protein